MTVQHGTSSYYSWPIAFPKSCFAVTFNASVGGYRHADGNAHGVHDYDAKQFRIAGAEESVPACVIAVGQQLQWGAKTQPAAQFSTISTNFPIAFTSFCIVVPVKLNCGLGNEKSDFGIIKKSLTSFSYCASGDMAGIDWLAVGKQHSRQWGATPFNCTANAQICTLPISFLTACYIVVATSLGQPGWSEISTPIISKTKSNFTIAGYAYSGNSLNLPAMWVSIGKQLRQWGWGTSSNGSGNQQSITFPLKFSACFGVSVSSVSDSSTAISTRYFQVSAYTSTSASFAIVYSGNSVPTTIKPFWFAVGK